MVLKIALSWQMTLENSSDIMSHPLHPPGNASEGILLVQHVLETLSGQ